MQELTVRVEDAEIIYGEEEFEEAEELEISCHRPLGEATEAVCRRSTGGLSSKRRGGKLVSLVENIFMRQQRGGVHTMSGPSSFLPIGYFHVT